MKVIFFILALALCATAQFTKQEAGAGNYKPTDEEPSNLIGGKPPKFAPSELAPEEEPQTGTNGFVRTHSSSVTSHSVNGGKPRVKSLTKQKEQVIKNGEVKTILDKTTEGSEEGDIPEDATFPESTTRLVKSSTSTTSTSTGSTGSRRPIGGRVTVIKTSKTSTGASPDDEEPSNLTPGTFLRPNRPMGSSVQPDDEPESPFPLKSTTSTTTTTGKTLSRPRVTSHSTTTTTSSGTSRVARPRVKSSTSTTTSTSTSGSHGRPMTPVNPEDEPSNLTPGTLLRPNRPMGSNVQPDDEPEAPFPLKSTTSTTTTTGKTVSRPRVTSHSTTTTTSSGTSRVSQPRVKSSTSTTTSTSSSGTSRVSRPRVTSHSTTTTSSTGSTGTTRTRPVSTSRSTTTTTTGSSRTGTVTRPDTEPEFPNNLNMQPNRPARPQTAFKPQPQPPRTFVKG